MAQVTPALLRYLHAELLGGIHDAIPRSVAFGVTHALYLIEASYGVSDMACVCQRLFPLFGESELIAAQLVLLSSA